MFWWSMSQVVRRIEDSGERLKEGLRGGVKLGTLR